MTDLKTLLREQLQAQRAALLLKLDGLSEQATRMPHTAFDEARHAGHADILRELIDGAVGRRHAGDDLPEWDEARWAAYLARLRALAERTP